MSTCRGYEAAPPGVMNSTGWFLTNDEPDPMVLPYTQRVWKCGWGTSDGSPPSPVGCQNGIGMRGGLENTIGALLTPTPWGICWSHGSTTLTPTFSVVPCPPPPAPPSPPVEWEWNGRSSIQFFSDASCQQPVKSFVSLTPNPVSLLCLPRSTFDQCDSLSWQLSLLLRVERGWRLPHQCHRRHA